FQMAWNCGINFGIGASEADWMRWVLIGVAAAICVGIVIWLRRAEGWLVPLSAGMVVGGAIGNVWDRVQYGAVADFLNMSCCGIRNPYSFNVADMAIFAGAIGLVLFTGREEKEG
ncbi:MAG: signal peptidase II, partial [Pseudomonadota bacterium]